MAVITALSVRFSVLEGMAAEKPSFTIQAADSTSGKTAEGIEFSVYQVAEMEVLGQYQLTTEFKNAGLKIAELDNAKQDEMQKKAAAVAAYAKNNQIASTFTLKTDAAGKTETRKSAEGLYLVVVNEQPDSAKQTVQATPFFISLPMMSALPQEAPVWEYDVTASPKLEITVKPSETEPPETDPSKPVQPSDPDQSSEAEQPSEPVKPDESTESTESTESAPEGSTGSDSNHKPGGSHNSNSHSGNSSSGNSSKNLVGINDPEVPLASFPTNPEEPELITVEEDAVPLAALPKLGDLGAGTSMAGLLLSLSAAGISLLARRKIDGRGDEE